MTINDHIYPNRAGWYLVVLLSAFLVGELQAGPLEPLAHPHPRAAQIVHEAEHAVDHAWETYHKAALGGTIASPAMQTDIEKHLHDARALMPRAHLAAERGDMGEVDSLVQQIHDHSNAAIAESMEHKK
ncbi:hypothetical protein YTPLAS18_01040 [Nitrospira sp.]|nr:hypothetical protein YTPLAS18_01040 [Nitrospira sp.]